MLGVDDWAWKRGHRYGTILVDLERHRVVDLLPDREANTLESWLRHHPGIAVISRDRSGAYADGASRGAPEAVQVADRWHLLKNLTEALERTLANQHVQIRQAHQATAQLVRRRVAVPPEPQPALVPHQAQRQQQASRARRLARYDEVITLHQQGFSLSAISRKTGRERKTVRRYLRAGRFREWAMPKRRSQLEAYLPYLEERWAAGCHNAAQLWRELRQRGFRGQAGIVRQWAGQKRREWPAAQQHGAVRTLPKTVPPPTPRKTAWLLLRGAANPQEQAFVDALLSQAPDLRDTAAAAREFARLVRERDAAAWGDWQQQAERTQLRGFAAQLRKDEAAVVAALRLPWSNGQVEGQVLRLKLIKRQMYGRARFDLLRQRVLFRAA